jgi:hypothetical protein
VIGHSYGLNADFAGFVQYHSVATYGKITSVTWVYRDGCGLDRVLWGDNDTVPRAPIVQANCMVRPSF